MFFEESVRVNGDCQTSLKGTAPKLHWVFKRIGKVPEHVSAAGPGTNTCGCAFGVYNALSQLASSIVSCPPPQHRTWFRVSFSALSLHIISEAFVSHLFPSALRSWPTCALRATISRIALFAPIQLSSHLVFQNQWPLIRPQWR